MNGHVHELQEAGLEEPTVASLMSMLVESRLKLTQAALTQGAPTGPNI